MWHADCLSRTSADVKCTAENIRIEKEWIRTVEVRDREREGTKIY